ncbi:PAS domain S-box protein [Gemmata sp.]|uniref:hybrid sensor histidine kinase/response regulator n=1 Tax=Gemmata sp. TaxID=1914242 RepID=UPI003F70DCD3
MAHVRPDGRWLRVNRKLCDILGYGHDELLGLTFQDITHPADLAADLAHVERLLAGDIPTYAMEKRYVRKDRSPVWVNLTVSLARTPRGRPDYFISVVEDISPRKDAEEQARTLADAIPHLCWTADPDGHIVWYNRRWVEYTGRGHEQMKGLRWVPVLDAAVQPRVLDRWLGCIATGRPFDMEFPIRGRDGEFRHFLTRAEPVRDGGGRVVRWFGTGTDITARVRAEQALGEADRRKDEFLATLAHELRNPLAPIRNALQILRLSPARDVQDRVHALMHRQLDQVVRLVDDLLDVSRISTGKLELRTERVPLRAVLDRAMEASGPLIDQMGHELTVSAPGQTLTVDADPARLGQVFCNLLNNAAKYMDRGGRIWLAVERQGSDAVVSVRDAGVGIAADQLPHIFQMFSQVEGSLDKSQGGLGIGLTLVKRLVEMHGGRIEARSDGPGRGSEFVVRLPVVVEASGPLAPVGPEPPAPRSSLRILVVDDNRDAAESVGMLLRIMGNDIRTAHDGQAGVDLAGVFRPDVVLLDIGLPRLNGYEACRRIRGQPWGAGVVLIAVTGWGQEGDRRRSHEAGFDHHMVKPVDPHTLMKLLEGLSAAKK